MAARVLAFMDRLEHLPAAVALRQRSYALACGTETNGAIVDVGCGSGRAVAELAERGMRACGVDPSEPALVVARRRYPACTFPLGARWTPRAAFRLVNG